MVKLRYYDFEKLKQYVGDDPAQVKEIIQIFLDTIPIEIEEIKQDAKNCDWGRLYKRIHKIKPSFEVFSMELISKEARQIELLAQENNSENNIDKYINSFETQINKVLSLLKEELMR